MYRIIVNMREGEFMLMRDFLDTTAATLFAQKVGFGTYEITNDFNDADWEVIDPKIDPDKLMSFMRRKPQFELDSLIFEAQKNGATAMQIAILKILNSPVPSSDLANAINNADWQSELKGLKWIIYLLNDLKPMFIWLINKWAASCVPLLEQNPMFQEAQQHSKKLAKEVP